MPKGVSLADIRNPLGLLALMVLVAEGLLFLLAEKASGNDFTIIVIGMVLVIPSTLLLLYLKPDLFHASDYNTPLPNIYDVFISAPMAAWEDDQSYALHRQEIMKLIDALKEQCKFRRIFYAGAEIESTADFEAHDLSAADDFNAIRASKFFVLIYPKSLPSGSLVEIGAAIAHERPCLIFTPSNDTLPFMLKHADQAFPHVKIYDADTMGRVIGLVKSHGTDLFPNNCA